MRVKATDFLPGRYLHIYNYAAQGLQLFRDTADYRICLGKIQISILLSQENGKRAFHQDIPRPKPDDPQFSPHQPDSSAWSPSVRHQIHRSRGCRWGYSGSRCLHQRSGPDF